MITIKCNSCGATVSDNAKFCPECGNKIIQRTPSDTIQLRCKACNGVMEVDPDRPILYCQYCGSKELLRESDTVTIQRIKSKTHKDIELEKIQFERDKEEEKNRREDIALERDRDDARRKEVISKQEKFRSGLFKSIIVVFFFLSMFAAIFSFSTGETKAGVIAVFQVLLFAFSWLKGMQFIKEKKPNSHLIYAIIGLLLIIPLFGSCGGSTSTAEKDNTFDWPSNGMFTVLPNPPTNKGDLHIYSDSIFVVLKEISFEEYYNYVEDCKTEGFIIEAIQDNTSYEAYNDDGYRIELRYSSGDSVWIHLYEPEKTE